MGDIIEFLKPATAQCSQLAYAFGFDPAALGDEHASPFDTMVDNIVNGGEITRESLAQALEKSLVGLGMLAIKVREYNFGKSTIKNLL